MQSRTPPAPPPVLCACLITSHNSRSSVIICKGSRSPFHSDSNGPQVSAQNREIDGTWRPGCDRRQLLKSLKPHFAFSSLGFFASWNFRPLGSSAENLNFSSALSLSLFLNSIVPPFSWITMLTFVVPCVYTVFFFRFKHCRLCYEDSSFVFYFPIFWFKRRIPKRLSGNLTAVLPF